MDKNLFHELIEHGRGQFGKVGVLLGQRKEAVDIDGIILTKLDSTAHGGVVISIMDELGIPVKLIGVGEKIDDLMPFDAKEFAEGLFMED